MITATFSNGYTDTYKGSRDVKAAWMVTEKATGKVIASGHSLSKEIANKTAKSHIPAIKYMSPNWRKDFRVDMLAVRLGYNDAKHMYSDYMAQNAKHAEKFDIEVVSI